MADKAHARGGARPNQPETTHFADCSALHMARLVGGGIMPEAGQFTDSVWAMFFGRSQRFVQEHFASLDVPYERLGDLCFYDARDVRSAMTRTTHTTDPSRKKRKRD